MAIDNEILHAILKLNPLSISKIAETIGQHRVNLQAGLAGKRSLPIHVVDALLKVSGIFNNMPNTNQVHVWKVGLNKSALNIAIPYFFPTGGEMGAVWRSNNLSIKKITDPLVQYIRHRNTRVIIVYKILVDGISPKDYPTLNWQDTADSEEKMITVGDRLDAWANGKISAREFDNTLGNQVASWDQVIKTAAEKGLDPDDILDYIERILVNRE